MLVSFGLILIVGLVFAFTVTFRGSIPTMHWTWIEGRRRFNVGQYSTKPVAQVVMTGNSQEGISLNAFALQKALLTAFTVDGEIVPYYLKAEVPAVKLVGKKTGDVLEFFAKVQVKYREIEWIFDDVISGVAPGTISITINNTEVVRAIVKFGNTQLGFHELEFGKNLQLVGLPIPRQIPPGSPAPGASPRQRTPLVEYMKTLP